MNIKFNESKYLPYIFYCWHVVIKRLFHIWNLTLSDNLMLIVDSIMNENCVIFWDSLNIVWLCSWKWHRKIWHKNTMFKKIIIYTAHYLGQKIEWQQRLYAVLCEDVLMNS